MVEDPLYQGVGYRTDIDVRRRLEFIIGKIVPTVGGDLSATDGALSPVLTNYFNIVKSDVTKRTPLSAEAFFNDLQAYNGQAPVPMESYSVYQTMRNDFGTILNFAQDASSGDPDVPNILDSYSLDEFFQRTFTEFLQTYPFPATGNPNAPTNTRDFVSQPYFLDSWRTYLSKVAFFEEASVPGGLDLSYEQIFNAYFDPNDSVRNAQILNLIAETIDKKGYFLPSHHIGDFLNIVSRAYAQALTGQKSGVSNPTGPTVLIRILHLLISLIDTVQQVATAQANRLGILTSWQKNYTDLMGEVRAFVKGGPERAETDEELNDDRRKSLNDANNIYTPTLQSRRQVVSDDAKALQSAINQSQDTVQNEASTVSSFLQQLSSLLSAIYR